MEEHTVAMIPHATVIGVLGPKRYGIVVTDRRCILVLESASKALLGGLLGGAVGAVVGEAATRRRAVDYESATPDILAMDAKNTAISYSSIQRLVLKMKAPYSCSLRIDYVRSDGKRKRVDIDVYPEPDLVSRRKSEGISRRSVVKELSESIYQTLLQALPPEVASRGEWKL